MSWTEVPRLCLLSGLCLTQLACLDTLLEAPLILTTGLPEIHGLAPSPHGSLLVATDEGLWEVQTDGSQRQLTLRPVQDVTTHPESITLLSDGVISWGPYPDQGAPLEVSGRLASPQATKILAWFDSSLIVAQGGTIEAWSRHTSERKPLHSVRGSVVQIELGGSHRDDPILVQTSTGLHRVSAHTSEEVAVPSPLLGAALDVHERLWIVHGPKGQLSIQEENRTRVITSSLGTPRSITLGRGGPLPTDALYIATAAGNIEYIQVPHGSR